MACADELHMESEAMTRIKFGPLSLIWGKGWYDILLWGRWYDILLWGMIYCYEEAGEHYAMGWGFAEEIILFCLKKCGDFY